VKHVTKIYLNALFLLPVSAQKTASHLKQAGINLICNMYCFREIITDGVIQVAAFSQRAVIGLTIVLMSIVA
jgi:hypothetical protein